MRRAIAAYSAARSGSPASWKWRARASGSVLREPSSARASFRCSARSSSGESCATTVSGSGRGTARSRPGPASCGSRIRCSARRQLDAAVVALEARGVPGGGRTQGLSGDGEDSSSRRAGSAGGRIRARITSSSVVPPAPRASATAAPTARFPPAQYRTSSRQKNGLPPDSRAISSASLAGPGSPSRASAGRAPRARIRRPTADRERRARRRLPAGERKLCRNGLVAASSLR